MASSKHTFASKTFGARTFAPGVFRGLGVEAVGPQTGMLDGRITVSNYLEGRITVTDYIDCSISITDYLSGTVRVES